MAEHGWKFGLSGPKGFVTVHAMGGCLCIYTKEGDRPWRVARPRLGSPEACRIMEFLERFIGSEAATAA